MLLTFMTIHLFQFHFADIWAFSAPKVPHVSYTGDNFASTSSVLIKSPFSEMPNSNSCDEFSVSELQRHQIVLFTPR